jgi:hypothetical protein
MAEICSHVVRVWMIVVTSDIVSAALLLQWRDQGDHDMAVRKYVEKPDEGVIESSEN